MCIFGGFLFLMKFTKPYKPVDSQLSRMEERQMVVDLPHASRSRRKNTCSGR